MFLTVGAANLKPGAQRCVFCRCLPATWRDGAVHLVPEVGRSTRQEARDLAKHLPHNLCMATEGEQALCTAIVQNFPSSAPLVIGPRPHIARAAGPNK